MADTIQLERLIASANEFNGCQNWNEWREQNPDVKVDLTQADLSWLNLIGVNLSEANLQGSDFTDANLSDAVLFWSDLSHCIFERATLVRANLFQSNLDQSHWADANLRRADLREANLRTAQHLGYDQIQHALGSVATQLPVELPIPHKWRTIKTPRANDQILLSELGETLRAFTCRIDERLTEKS